MSDVTTPKTWQSGEFFTAPHWNIFVRDNGYFVDNVDAPTSVSNSAAQVDLFNSAVTIPGRLMGSHRRIQLFVTGGFVQHTGGSPSGPTFRLKWGDVIFEIDMSLSNGTGSTTTEGAWYAQAEIRQMAATNAQESWIYGEFLSGAQVNLATGVGVMRDNGGNGKYFFGRNSSTVDATAPHALQWIVENAIADPDYTTKFYSATVLIL